MNERAQSFALLLLASVMLVVVGLSIMARPVHQRDVRSTMPITYRVDVNSADRDTLSLLPGIAKGKCSASWTTVRLLAYLNRPAT